MSNVAAGTGGEGVVWCVVQVKFLSNIGSATAKDFVSRTLSKVLHPGFAKNFVWAGRLTYGKLVSSACYD